MELSGTIEIRAPRAQVWAFIIDPEQIGRCGPGVETIELLDPTHYRVTAKIGFGIFSTRLAVEVERAEAVEPDRAVIHASGHAAGGSAEAVAEITLAGPPDGPTTLTLTGTATIGGTFASFGSGLLDGTADKLIGETVACIRSKLEA